MGKNFFEAIKDGLIVDGGGGTPAPALIDKTITANGEYSASDDSADGYRSVTANVANSYTAQDEGKVVSGGALVSQLTHKSIAENGTDIDTTTYSSVDVSVPNSYSASDEGKVVSNGALVSQSSSSASANGTVDTTLINSLAISVPNTYSAGDEGKVVSNGALVAQVSDSVLQNGTVDTTLINSLLVNVPTGAQIKRCSFHGISGIGSACYQIGNFVIAAFKVPNSPNTISIKDLDLPSTRIKDFGFETYNGNEYAAYKMYDNSSYFYEYSITINDVNTISLGQFQNCRGVLILAVEES